MNERIMIVPGKNPVLHYFARQIAGRADVLVFGSANELLWQARQTPPGIVLSDVQLDDMSGAELAEILPNFAPSTRILICGPANSTGAGRVEAVGAEYVPLGASAAENVRLVYRALDMTPPAVLPRTAELQQAPAKAAQAPEFKAAPFPVRAGTVPSRNHNDVPAMEAPAVVQTTAVKDQPAGASTAPTTDSFAPSGALIIQPQQHQVLTKLLDLLAKEVGAQCVLLIDPAGMVLVQSGVLTSVVIEMVGPLLATSFSTTSQLARHLQEQSTNATYIHEGDRYDIYAFNVSYRVSLIIMFDKRVNPGKLGTVWVYAKRAMRQLQQILKL